MKKYDKDFFDEIAVKLIGIAIIGIFVAFLAGFVVLLLTDGRM